MLIPNGEAASACLATAGRTVPNDRQIKEVSYREVEADAVSYAANIRQLS
jgi:hypothetical protein